MFHAPPGADDGMLQTLREQVDHWLRRAITHGRRTGAVRDDLPEALLIELTLAVLHTLDRWAVRHAPQSPPALDAARSVHLVRDLVERR
jgi:hypothetical protein